MEIHLIERTDDITHLALIGRLDVQGVQEIDARFAGYTSARLRPAIVDLTHVDFVASLGMGMLLSNAAALERSGVKMVLLNPQAMVEKVLRTVYVDRHLPIVRSEAEALAIFGS